MIKKTFAYSTTKRYEDLALMKTNY